MKRIFEHLQQNWIRYGFESVAILVSILAAFALNNWNENRKQAKLEERVLLSLRDEVNTNIPIINDCLQLIDQRMAYADSLQKYLGPKYANLPREKLVVWLGFAVGSTERCVLQTDVSDELRSSGNLNQIQDVSIRRKISALSAAITELREANKEWSLELSNVVLPYTNSRISWDDVDYLFNPDDPNYLPSSFKYDPNLVLQDFEFANILAVNYWRMKRYKSRIQKILDTSKKLIELLDKEMKK